MSEDSAKTKGIGFSNVKSFTTEHYGERGWECVLESLNDADRAEMLSVVPVEWYSLSLYARLIRAVDKVHGQGDLRLLEQIGRYEAQHDLTYVQRIFLKLANPAYVIEMLGKLWSRFHDTGYWEVTRFTSTHATGILRDWGTVDRALCLELIGYLARSIEICGGHGVVVEHPKCRSKGDSECVYEARWRS